MQMVTVGGRIVYSTCTFNPVENEAIVAAVLQKYPGTAEDKNERNALWGG